VAAVGLTLLALESLGKIGIIENLTKILPLERIGVIDNLIKIGATLGYILASTHIFKQNARKRRF
jgi:hypothetical protein